MAQGKISEDEYDVWRYSEIKKRLPNKTHCDIMPLVIKSSFLSK